ncbi:MAG: thiol-disulfide oxidoreductase DCC family protein [Arenicella sp.]
MKSTLYYDGNCPICSKEMALLKKLKNSQLELVDLWQAEIHIPQENLLKILHLRTPEGNWKKGLDANVAAWKHTRIGFLFLPLRWPLIKPIADKIYSRWAEKRFCKIQLKSQQP